MRLRKRAHTSRGVLVLIACFAGSAALAQDDANARSALARTLAGLAGSNFRNVVSAAEAMPESEYGFRPAAKARSFAELVAHVADANRTFCSSIAATGIPFEPRAEKEARHASASKARLIADLRSSFESCETALASFDEARASEQVELGGGERIDGKAVPRRIFPAGAVLAVLASHTSLHYGNMATYLRMKNVVPPTSQDVSP